MANRLPVTLDFGTLPQTGQGYTPQQFANVLGTNGAIFTEQEFALFVTGSTAPTSDVGPWLANGNEWRVWSDDAGAYVPITIAQQSLGYFVGEDEPDPLLYQFWIELAAGGSPLALKTYYSGAWTDVYATTLAGYMTIAAFNTAIAAYAPLASPTFTGTPAGPTAAPGTNTTQLATTAYVLAAISGATPTPFAAYPAQGVADNQVILVDGNQNQIEFDLDPINPAPSPFDVALFRYIAPADGYYSVAVATQFDNIDGTPASMQVAVSLFKNGVAVGNGMYDLDSTPSPVGARWSPGFSGLVQLAQDDYIEIFVEATDGVNTGSLNLAVSQFSVHRVQAV